MNRLYHKVKYAFMIIDPGIDRFITHELKSRFCNCDLSIIVFGIRVMCLGFSNKSHVDIFTESEKQLLVRSNLTQVFVLRGIQKKRIWKLNIQINSFKTRYWMILQHVSINSLLNKMTVMTQRLYNI